MRLYLVAWGNCRFGKKHYPAAAPRRALQTQTRIRGGENAFKRAAGDRARRPCEETHSGNQISPGLRGHRKAKTAEGGLVLFIGSVIHLFL